MTTATKATKPKPASAELASLQKTRDRLHAKVRAAKTAMGAWDAETEGMRAQMTALVNAHPEQVEGVEKRVKPDTEAAKLRDQIIARMRGENPHRTAYEEALAPYLQADEALQEFKRTRLDDRLAELDPDAERSIERIREAFALLRDACDEYRQAVVRIRDVVVDTPGLNGMDQGEDPRPEGWRRDAQKILDGEIAKPGLTPVGAAKAASHV
jgi:hypothetical protein